MIWMMLIMFLPIFGVALFFIVPLAAAIPFYITLLVISGLYHCLMMGAIRLPSQMGPEKMAGSTASVRNWSGNSGQVAWRNEIWRARTLDGSPLGEAQDVVIAGRRGLTLWVKPADAAQARKNAGKPAAEECLMDRLVAFPHHVGRRLKLQKLDKVFAWPHREQKLAR